MKTSCPLLATVWTLILSSMVVSSLHAEDTLPKAPPATRYDAMAERSPFTAPTAAPTAPVAAPPAPGPHWWDQMFITSLMDRGGVYYAAVVDKASNKHFMLEINKADPDSQLLLSSVQWNDHLDQTTATVSKGPETAPPLRFDATASAPAPAAPMGSGPSSMQSSFVPPKSPGMNPGTLPPGFTGTPPPPPPGMPTVVRRSGPIVATPPANSRNGVQQPSSGQPRRIVPNNSESSE